MSDYEEKRYACPFRYCKKDYKHSSSLRNHVKDCIYNPINVAKRKKEKAEKEKAEKEKQVIFIESSRPGPLTRSQSMNSVGDDDYDVSYVGKRKPEMERRTTSDITKQQLDAFSTRHDIMNRFRALQSSEQNEMRKVMGICENPTDNLSDSDLSKLYHKRTKVFEKLQLELLFCEFGRLHRENKRAILESEELRKKRHKQNEKKIQEVFEADSDDEADYLLSSTPKKPSDTGLESKKVEKGWLSFWTRNE